MTAHYRCPGTGSSFRRVVEPDDTTADAGTGFGLNCVNRIVLAHDWDVRATEGADGGARFEITGVETAE